MAQFEITFNLKEEKLRGLNKFKKYPSIQYFPDFGIVL